MIKIKKIIFLQIILILCITIVFSIDADNDTFHSIQTGGTDCNDNNATINPNATEIFINFVDDDCDGWINRSKINIRSTHPRIWLNEDILQKLRNDTLNGSKNSMFQIYESAFPTGSSWTEVASGQALLYIILKDSNYTLARDYSTNAVDYLVNEFTTSGSRETRRDKLLVLSLAYDWMYDEFNESEKEILRTKMKELADTQIYEVDIEYENGPFANYRFGPVSSVGLAGLAMYGDDPDANYYFNWSLNKFNDTIKVLNHFEDGGWHEGYNYDWESTGVGLRLFDGIRTATSYNPLDNTDFYKYHGIWYVYGMRPDDTWARFGDVGYPTVINFQVPWFAFMASYYNNSYVQWFYKNKIMQDPSNPYGSTSTLRNRGFYAVSDLIWYNPDLPEKEPTDLDLFKYFSGLGMVIGRSDWTQNATWFSFYATDHYTSHGHFDEGSFQIFKNNALAIDSGMYDSGANNGLHLWGYSKRTISHNTLLIYDPDEETVLWRYNPNVDYPDGGQRINQGSPTTFDEWVTEYNSGDYTYEGNPDSRTTSYHLSDWLGFVNTQNYTYMAVDITKAYDSYKVNNVTRQIVYLSDDYFVIFDRVDSKYENHKKKWLLHSINRPIIYGNNVSYNPLNGTDVFNSVDHFVVSNEGSSLYVKTVLPINYSITTVGGEGYEYYYNNTNHVPDRTTLHEGEEPGAWRVEVSPKSNNTQDFFLNILCPNNVTDIETQIITNISANTDTIGLIINKTNIVHFSKTSSSITNLSYVVSLENPTKHLVVNLVPNATYYVYDNQMSEVVNSTGSGTLLFATSGVGVHSFVVSNIPLNITYYHFADKNKNGIIDIDELLSQVSLWKNFRRTMGELMDVLKEWKDK